MRVQYYYEALKVVKVVEEAVNLGNFTQKSFVLCHLADISA